MRTASINRDTMETQIRLSLELDGILQLGPAHFNHVIKFFGFLEEAFF